MGDGARNLTGVWYGRYDATAYPETNTFIAQLTDNGGVISGTITEPDTTGQADIRRAFVSGRHAGPAIEFTKQYDGGVLAHAVRYWGLVNDQASEISGRWIIVREQGTFVMTRETFAAEELEDEREVELTP